jgi:hypothetical protein
MPKKQKITNKNWMPQISNCGHFAVYGHDVVVSNIIATSRDISTQTF